MTQIDESDLVEPKVINYYEIRKLLSKLSGIPMMAVTTSEHIQYIAKLLNNCTPPPHHITVTIDTRTHRVVPLIPDENMYHAAVKCKNVMFVTGAGLPTEHFPFGAAWSAMLAAAPEHKE